MTESPCWRNQRKLWGDGRQRAIMTEYRQRTRNATYRPGGAICGAHGGNIGPLVI